MRRIILSLLLGGIVVFASLFTWILFPSGFYSQEVFLAQGTVPRGIAKTLEDAQIVQSGFALRAIIKLRGTAGALVPGDYLFDKKQSVFKVASRITNGDFGIDQKRVTIPEGFTNEQIANIIRAEFSDFDKDTFLLQAEGKQGYLFPETYYFLTTSTVDIIGKLTDSFDYHVRALQAEALSNGKDWDDIVTMASLLEEEADTVEDYKIISGILWKRLLIGMALQVDVAPITYKMRGLPIQPLSNPGLVTLEAALHPTETKYFFYLTGKDGLMHYAVTFDEHKKNIATYLR